MDPDREGVLEADDVTAREDGPSTRDRLVTERSELQTQLTTLEEDTFASTPVPCARYRDQSKA